MGLTVNTSCLKIVTLQEGTVDTHHASQLELCKQRLLCLEDSGESFSGQVMLPVPQAAACGCAIGKTYVFTCFCSGDGLCQALCSALPCFPWN